MTFADITPARKGRVFADFTLGQTFVHHWGRTLGESDGTAFGCLTLNYNPIYLNAEFAAERGHHVRPLNPYLAFLTVLGLSVEDLSEGSVEGAFLGIDDLAYYETVTAGDTLVARSEVVGMRPSESRPGSGVVTWRTRGFNQHGNKVLAFTRTNIVGSTTTS
ncbi:acyl dehydratase [Nocardioides ginsengisegetis]|uniref:Acyl dehydratase n=1 Tax=Nocardioides ginsengisegetis TaxID=661491 RepID=A0A7W3P9B9_9ACTN|nr:MaoC family dehydratase [Nocardioides ginsengisegetis]MBA8803262.1 acyl dehydratase [Nocardioides ginsengisegetis]